MFIRLFVIIIVITIFITKNWPPGWATSAYKVLRWEVRSGKQARDQETEEPHKAQPGLPAFFLHPICFPLPPPIHSRNSFLKHPTRLQIKAIAVMARVQAQAGRIKERQTPLIQTHTAYLSPFWKPVTQM